MMRIKFLKSIQGPYGGFDTGQIVEMEDGPGRAYCAQVYSDGTRLAVQVQARACPHCGGRLEEEPAGPAGALEAATVSHAPRRR